jgi:hypothetical protein
MKKLILSLSTLFTVSYSYAAIKIDACVKSHPEGTNCYELHITITDTDPVLGPVFIASSDVWVGGTSSEPCPPAGMVENPNPNCGIFTFGNDIFVTNIGSPCIEGVLSNPSTYALYEAARDSLLNYGNTGLMRKTQEPSDPSIKSMVSNKQILTVYPNPSSSKDLIIQTKVDNKQTELMMNVYDITGKKVYDLDLTGKEIARINANVSQLSIGTYQFVLSTKRNILASQKVILQ